MVSRLQKKKEKGDQWYKGNILHVTTPYIPNVLINRLLKSCETTLNIYQHFYNLNYASR